MTVGEIVAAASGAAASGRLHGGTFVSLGHGGTLVCGGQCSCVQIVAGVNCGGQNTEAGGQIVAGGQFVAKTCVLTWGASAAAGAPAACC